ncbi:CLUMA_CG015974, isoform A [Clunio marinus]|uniref:CLUMA_CG015974, isoform A n=1 Tax=Clunio marinus TaxID=568069 RepID=A0A1J1IRV5_9DIPT|nr:CLUMA_CG015974, isoform A [Clunio marinus]
MSFILPDALSPQTLQATNVFGPVEELDEFESAADDAVLAFVDDVVTQDKINVFVQMLNCIGFTKLHKKPKKLNFLQ